MTQGTYPAALLQGNLLALHAKTRELARHGRDRDRHHGSPGPGKPLLDLESFKQQVRA